MTLNVLIRICAFLAGTVLIVSTFLTCQKQGLAYERRCWSLSPDLYSTKAVADYMNQNGFGSDSIVLHNFKNGIVWQVMYQIDCPSK